MRRAVEGLRKVRMKGCKKREREENKPVDISPHVYSSVIQHLATVLNVWGGGPMKLRVYGIILIFCRVKNVSLRMYPCQLKNKSRTL